MKRFLALLLAAVLLFACEACAKKTPEAPSGENGIAENTSFHALASFTAKTLNGETFTQDDLKAYDLTVVNIWGTFCGPCLGEMDDLAAFAKTLPENVQFITICTDASVAHVQTAKRILEDAGYEGITLIDGSGDYSAVLDRVIYVPTTLFFDADGKCVGKELIGAQSDFAGVYTERVNALLTAMGKDAI